MRRRHPRRSGLRRGLYCGRRDRLRLSRQRAKFLADECVDARVIEELAAAGHDIRSVRETAAGLTDATVLELASEEGRILLTEDKDFGELAFRLRRVAVPGIVLLRIDPAARQLKGARMVAAIHRFGEGLTGHYTVVHENRLRTRSLI